MSDPSFEELMRVSLPPEVGEDCAAIRNYIWNGKRVKDDLCIVCRKPLTSKRQRMYCSSACSNWFHNNHDWTAARNEALRLNFEKTKIVEHRRIERPEEVITRMVLGERKMIIIPARVDEYTVKYACCSRCGNPNKDYGDFSSRLEVDHIHPLDGGYRAKTCFNHQENLRVVCHKCHVELTAEQRAAGLITSAKVKKERNNA